MNRCGIRRRKPHSVVLMTPIARRGRRLLFRFEDAASNHRLARTRVCNDCASARGETATIFGWLTEKLPKHPNLPVPAGGGAIGFEDVSFRYWENGARGERNFF